MKKALKKLIVLNFSDLQAVSGGLVYEDTTTKPDGTTTTTKKELTVYTPIGTVK